LELIAFDAFASLLNGFAARAECINNGLTPEILTLTDMSDIHSILIVGFPCLEIAEF
jgi:hypothetical protein